MVCLKIYVATLLALSTFSVHGAPAAANHWIDTWTAMPQLTEFSNLPYPPFNNTNLVFPNSTIRQTLHMSIGAGTIRIRISNAFGATCLPVTAATIAYPKNGIAGASNIQVNSLKQLTFSGSKSVVIPNGALIVSDPVQFTIEPQSEITITMYLADGQTTQLITSHPGSRTNSYYSFGNYVNAANMTDPSTQVVAHWYFLSAVEAWVPTASSAFAIIGDSITDGRGSDTNKNDRWPDLVLRKMQANPSTANIAVLNQATGGNRILLDGLGPNALGRIDRDVLAQSGVKYAMIFEGLNDIGTGDLTEANQTAIYNQLIIAYEQMITRVHTFGIPMFAATITPFGAPNTTIQPYASTIRDATRNKVNDWIRTSGKFDAVVDFDQILRDPANHTQLNPIYNSGDGLHPNEAGYQLLADKFPLNIFTKFAEGVSTYN
ncbi:hypothetical protein MMC25_004907 [Agyrium rufum]|nr:hypothetical protein [Agyrium rufum]